MDLLNENRKEEKVQPKGKKMVLILLILSIIAFIAIICAMVFISQNDPTVNQAYININNEKVILPENLIASDAEGNQYISLKQLSILLGYEYYNNAYGSYGLDTTKCYIKNGNLICGFEADKKIIYKYEEGTNLDYQHYILMNNVITYNDELYISIYDLREALNVDWTRANNELTIYTTEYLAKLYNEQLASTGYKVTTDVNNQKALSYGWIIANKNDVWGVLNTDFQEIIDAKYSSIYFDENSLNYIVANTSGQYGIIGSSGKVEQALAYEGIEILNYENMIYKVKYNDKYGIIDADGKMITKIEYDEIGYKADASNKILYTLIIPKLSEEAEETIVVMKDNLYGLVGTDTGNIYLPCDHVEKLYSINELGKIEYKIEAEGITMDLEEYLKLRGIVPEN